MITNVENFKCPSCWSQLSEDDMYQACEEPFNGVIVTCEECNTDLIIDILFKIEEE